MKRNFLKILSYPLTIVYLIIFGITLLIFEAIQRIAFLFGYNAHKNSVDALNFCLVQDLKLLGTTFSIEGVNQVPLDQPIIFVSNHQSMYDIPVMIWYLRKNHPKFVSKIELGKNIPSISYNLRHGGSVLIDRKDSGQALREIAKLGKYIEENNRSAVIFPEGTRSRNGEPKRFSQNGLKILSKFAPSALIVPITINNSYKIIEDGMFPHRLGVHFKLKVHHPIKPNKELNVEELSEVVREIIVKDITSKNE